MNSTQERTNEKVTGIMIIPTALGYKRIPISKLNFIDIEQRSLCYHLLDGEVKAAHILRTSFCRAIEHYLVNENLMFLKPSLLFNIDNVVILNKDHLIFANGDILYFPKKYYAEIYERWAK